MLAMEFKYIHNVYTPSIGAFPYFIRLKMRGGAIAKMSNAIIPHLPDASPSNHLVTILSLFGSVCISYLLDAVTYVRRQVILCAANISQCFKAAYALHLSGGYPNILIGLADMKFSNF